MFTQDLKKESGGNAHSDSLCGCVVPGAHKKGALVFFAVYAPKAERVFLVGSFNLWSDAHPLSHVGAGMWETCLPLSEIRDGDTYKFKICEEGREIYVTDPYAVENDGPPHFNSVYRYIPDELSHTYENEDHVGCLGMPVNIYEVRADLMTGTRGSAHYRDIARETVPYLLQMGFTHICLSGVFESYYDHAHAHGEQAYFAPHREQGGVEELREMIHVMHASGIGVLLDWHVSHIPEDVTGERFLVDNALYWLELYGMDGFVIGGDDAVCGEALSRLICEIKKEKTDAYFIARDADSTAKMMGADTTVKACDAYCSRFSTPENGSDRMRMQMAARAYLAFLEGRMITYMGCEIGMCRNDIEEKDIGPRTAETGGNARFQLFVSDLNSLYLSHESLWQRDRRVRFLSKKDGGIAVIECASDSDRVLLAVDLSGRGGEITLPIADGEGIILDTSSQRYGQDGRMTGQGLRGGVATLQAYGAIVLG